MKKFTNVSLLSTFFAIGGVATALVTATPAQALLGNLSWSDGTNDFFSDVNPVANDTFTVNFSPDNVTLINSATGVFVPTFTPAPPPYDQDLTVQAATFTYSRTQADGFIYTLNNDLSFNFGNGSTVTWGQGTPGVGAFVDIGGSVQFELEGPGNSHGITIAGTEWPPAPTDVLQFGDSVDPAGGSYNGVVDAVPEPTTILGSLVALGMGAKLKRKKGSVEPK
jgi:hypothetical protein